MAISTSDVLITTTWTQLSTAATGDFLLQNEAQAGDKFAAVGSSGSSSIRYAFAASTPTCRGMLLYAGCQISRGSVDGNVWAKCDSDSGTILAQVSE